MSTWSELEEVQLDVEINLNNRLLTYIEEDLEYSVLTPNSMILGRDIKLPDDSPEEEEVINNWKKQQKRDMYINVRKQLGKDGFINTWQLSERDNLSHKEKPVKININDVVIIKADAKNWGKWEIGIIENIFMAKDNPIRLVGIRTGKKVIERPVQLLYPMELHCHSKLTTSYTQDDKTLNVNAEEFQPKRSAAAVAEQRIRDIADNKNQ